MARLVTSLLLLRGCWAVDPPGSCEAPATGVSLLQTSAARDVRVQRAAPKAAVHGSAPVLSATSKLDGLLSKLDKLTGRGSGDSSSAPAKKTFSDLVSARPRGRSESKLGELLGRRSSGALPAVSVPGLGGLGGLGGLSGGALPGRLPGGAGASSAPPLSPSGSALPGLKPSSGESWTPQSFALAQADMHMHELQDKSDAAFVKFNNPAARGPAGVAVLPAVPSAAGAGPAGPPPRDDAVLADARQKLGDLSHSVDPASGVQKLGDLPAPASTGESGGPPPDSSASSLSTSDAPSAFVGLAAGSPSLANLIQQQVSAYKAKLDKANHDAIQKLEQEMSNQIKQLGSTLDQDVQRELGHFTGGDIDVAAGTSGAAQSPSAPPLSGPAGTTSGGLQAPASLGSSGQTSVGAQGFSAPASFGAPGAKSSGVQGISALAATGPLGSTLGGMQGFSSPAISAARGDFRSAQTSPKTTAYDDLRKQLNKDLR